MVERAHARKLAEFQLGAGALPCQQMARVLLVDDNMDLGALLASAFSERGHVTTLHVLGRDALVTVQTQPLDAAVVDLHLPDIRGTEVLAALASRGVPAVAISGVFRGPVFAKKITEEFGARALIEKPFELAVLLDTVEQLLPDASPQPPRAPVPELSLGEAVDVDPASSANEAAALALAAERDAASKRALPDLPFSGRQVWAGGSSARPSTAQVRALAALVPHPQSLAGTSVARLLGAAHQGRATGELRLRRGAVLKVIFLADGKPIYAASNVAAERFGRHALLQGAVSADDLVTVQELAAREKLRTGEAMVKLGLISAEQRVELLGDQAVQIIASSFEWPDGEHQFITRPAPRSDIVPLDVPLPLLLVSGFARLPLVKLRDRVPATLVPSPAPDPTFELHELELTPVQARLVMAADGTKTVEDLLALTDLEERDALALLATLLELRVIEPRPAGGNRRIVMV